MFPYREVFHKAANMMVLIGNSSLNMALMNEDGSYKSKQAQSVDEQFYGYVEDKYFDLPDKEFGKIVNKILD